MEKSSHPPKVAMCCSYKAINFFKWQLLYFIFVYTLNTQVSWCWTLWQITETGWKCLNLSVSVIFLAWACLLWWNNLWLACSYVIEILKLVLLISVKANLYIGCEVLICSSWGHCKLAVVANRFAVPPKLSKGPFPYSILTIIHNKWMKCSYLIISMITLGLILEDKEIIFS